ncbi:MAG TPA: hypothetical protein VJ742_04390, partial [Nitrososphaera sp.]|nr:hypothetical protein [Nitrososphaera sp.]
LNADTESTLKTTFSDAFSGQLLDSSDVMYDLRILDMNGTVVHSEAGLTANGGTDTLAIDFPSNENYRIEIQVQGIAQDGGSVDKTRNGVARGTVVVPEFPAGVLVVTLALASIVLVQRYARNQGFKGLS